MYRLQNMYLSDNNLLLPQFRSGGIDSKTSSEHFRDNQKLALRFWSSLQLPY